MKHFINFFLIIMLILSVTQKIKGQPRQEFYNLGNFALESGEQILNCKIGYRIIGQFNSDKSNVILWPTWFAGTSKDIINLIGKDKLIDSSDFCIIIIDTFGNGVSSSPSNSEEQPGNKFPVFTIRDLVHSQYQLATKKFMLNHIYCIIGGSMGGMQAIQWIVSYPDFMTKAIPYLATPFRSSYDLLLNKLQMEIIESGFRNNLPSKEIQFQLNLLLSLVAQTPEKFAKTNERKDFGKYLKNQNREPSKNFTLDNYLIQLKAMYPHDITIKADSSIEKVSGLIKAKTLFIVSNSDHIVQPYHTLEFAKMINAEIYIIESNCGHLAVNCDLENTRNKIMKFLRR